MPRKGFSLVLWNFCRLVGMPAAEGVSDGQLLERFALRNEETAFAALMHRHGPMVLGVCRRVLRDEHDVEDAFQATFLLLLRNASAIRRRESVGSWLHSVAYRLASDARVDAARRRAHETQAGERCAPEQPGFEAAWRELQAVLDEELQRLPEKYRAPLVLCYLEGKTHDEAAQELCCPLGTVKGRLSRARDLLRARLARRGLTLSAGAFAAVLAVNAASAAVPTALAVATAQFALGAASVPTRVSTLVEGVTRALFLTRLKTAATLLLAAVAVATSAGILAQQARTGKPVDALQTRDPPAPTARPNPPAPIDRHGDPLPEGVLARLGTPRLSTGSTLFSFAFTPDGKTLAAGGEQDVLVWDAATGAVVRRLKGHEGRVFDVALAPDGKALASAGLDRTIRLWDLSSGKELRQFRGHQGKVFRLMFSPDGRTLLSSGMDGTLRLWEVASGNELSSWQAPAGAWAIAFLTDSRTFATRDQHDTIVLWDALTGEERRRFDCLPAPLSAVALAPDGKVLAMASAGQPAVRLWDAETGRELRQLHGHSRGVVALSFSADGRRLVSAGEDRTIRLWDVGAGEEVARLQTDQDQFYGLILSADGKTLASGCDTAVCLWSLAAGRPLHPFVGHRGKVWSVAFSPDGRTLVSVGMDGTARLWDPSGGEQRSLLELPPQHEVLASALSPDGRTLACGSRDRTLHILDLATGKELRRWPAHEKAISCVAYSADGLRLASGSRGGDGQGKPMPGEVKVWDARSGRELLSLREDNGGVASVAFSPDGRLVAAGCRDGVIRLWQAATGTALYKLRTGADPVQSVAFSPDGRALACATGRKGSPGGLSLWDVATGQKRGQLAGHEDRANCATFSPDGRLLASAGADEKVRVWELATGREVAALGGHQGAVVSVAFSPDGALLASGGMDTTVLVWEMKGR